MSDLITAFLFFLPAGLANMSPVFASRLPLLEKWETPIDGGRTYKGKRIFGAHKTWRGLLIGTLMGAFIGWFVYRLAPDILDRLGIISFSPAVDMAIIGAALGFGALVGDSIESFFKRQKGVQPGKTWFPFDQTDYIIGGLLFSYPFAHPSLTIIILVFVLYFGLHLLFSYLGYIVGLKDKPI